MTATAMPAMIANVVLFQAGWFACVLGAARGEAWIGVAAAAAVVAWHGLRAARTRTEIALIAITILIGALWDSAVSLLGWINYAPQERVHEFAPLWILAIWALFATTLNVSMRWLKQRLKLALLLGAVGGPLSYWAAERLGAVQFVEPLAAVTALAVGWGLIMPALMLLSRVWDGITPAPERAS